MVRLKQLLLPVCLLPLVAHVLSLPGGGHLGRRDNSHATARHAGPAGPWSVLGSVWNIMGRNQRTHRAHKSLPAPAFAAPVVPDNWAPSTVNDELSSDEMSDRIHRGWKARPHEFPHMVRIKALFPRDLLGRHPTRSCGGALISDRWVITARHCATWSDPNLPGDRLERNAMPAIRLKVFVGGHSHHGEDGLGVFADRGIGRADYGLPQCSRRPDRSCDQPGGKTDTIFTNDIMLIRMERPVPMGQKVFPALLPPPPPLDEKLGLDIAFVSGWGIMDKRELNQDILKVAEMQVLPGFEGLTCQAQFSWGKMCAAPTTWSPRSGSTCPGDSGSPLVVPDNNGRWTIIGLLSNGARSCFDGYPSVFTRVADYLPWIQDTIRDDEVAAVDTNDLGTAASDLRQVNVRTDYQVGIDWKVPRRPPRQFYFL